MSAGPQVRIALAHLVALLDALPDAQRAALQISMDLEFEPVPFSHAAEHDRPDAIADYARSLDVAARGEAAAREWDATPPPLSAIIVQGPTPAIDYRTIPPGRIVDRPDPEVRPRWAFRGSSVQPCGGDK